MSSREGVGLATPEASANEGEGLGAGSSQEFQCVWWKLQPRPEGQTGSDHHRPLKLPRKHRNQAFGLTLGDTAGLADLR